MLSGAILHTDKSARQSPAEQGLQADKGLSERGLAPLLVIDAHHVTEPDRPRTASPFGISHHEAPRLAEALALYRRGYAAGVFVSLMHGDEGTVRDMTRLVQNRVTTYQGRAAMRAKHWAKVYEARPSIHAHIVAPFPTTDAAARFVAYLNSSAEMLAYGPSAVLAKMVQDVEGGWQGLTTYMLFEVTPQAHYATGRCYPRAKGSHELGEGGGDRVTLSEATEKALISSGRIEPHRRTYASRAISRPTKSERARGVVQCEQQLVLFPQVEKPVHRLREFVAGHAPETVATEIQFLMRRRGLTQQAIAERAGISRQRLGNFLHGRFGTTAWTIERIREVLAA